MTLLSCIDWSQIMLPLLSLHALAAQRGDGLRPELKALLEHRAGLAMGLAASIEPVEEESLSLTQVIDLADRVLAKESKVD
jgi:hypothetical protein